MPKELASDGTLPTMVGKVLLVRMISRRRPFSKLETWIQNSGSIILCRYYKISDLRKNLQRNHIIGQNVSCRPKRVHNALSIVSGPGVLCRSLVSGKQGYLPSGGASIFCKRQTEPEGGLGTESWRGLAAQSQEIRTMWVVKYLLAKSVKAFGLTAVSNGATTSMTQDNHVTLN